MAKLSSFHIEQLIDLYCTAFEVDGITFRVDMESAGVRFSIYQPLSKKSYSIGDKLIFSKIITGKVDISVSGFIDNCRNLAQIHSRIEFITKDLKKYHSGSDYKDLLSMITKDIIAEGVTNIDYTDYIESSEALRCAW